MTFQRISGDTTNLFVALHICARRTAASPLVEELLRCLCAAGDVSEHLIACLSSGEITDAAGQALQSFLTSELFDKNDSAVRWVKRFYLRARQYLFGHDDFVPEYFIEELERCTMLEESVFRGWVGHYRDDWWTNRLHSRFSCELLVPFFLILHRPVERWRQISEVDSTLIAVVNDKQLIELGELSELSSNTCGRLDSLYCWFVALNVAETLGLGEESNGEPLIASTEHIAPHFGLGAAGIESRLYLRKVVSGAAGSEARHHLQVEPKRVQTFFASWNEPFMSDGIDWDEVCLKLRLRKHSAPRLIQGLDPALHFHVVQVLAETGVLLTVPQMCARLHIDDLPLKPEFLTAGRIVAYVPGMRFLQPDLTRYGLREWVEDANHQRGRICRSRIVSPLDFSAAGLSAEAIIEAAQQEGLVQRHGILDLPPLLSKLAPTFGEASRGPQYAEILRKQVVSALHRNFVPIGHGFWANRSRWPILKGVRNAALRRVKVTTGLNLPETNSGPSQGTAVEGAPAGADDEDWQVLSRLLD